MTAHREFTRADKFLRAAVSGTCAWEFLALATPLPLPTVSRISKRYPMFGAAVIAGLALHFWPVTNDSLCARPVRRGPSPG